MTFPTSPTVGQVYATTKGDRWEWTGNGWRKSTVNLKTITQDTTIIVGSDYPTLDAAVAALKNFYIVPNVVLTIQLPVGLSTLSTPGVGYAGPGVIKLKGATMLGAFPTISDISVSGYNLASRNADMAANHALCIARFASHIYAPGMDGIVCNQDGRFDYIEDVYIYGDGTNGNGLVVSASQSTTVTRVATGKFGNGIYIHSAGRLSGTAGTILTFGNANQGVNCLYGSMYCGSFQSYGNGGSGLSAQNNGFIGSPSLKAAGNAGNGVLSSDASYVEVTSAVLRKSTIGNGGYGLRAVNGGQIYATGVDAVNQASTSFYAAKRGFIDASGALGSPSFNPTANTEGNNHAYICG